MSPRLNAVLPIVCAFLAAGCISEQRGGAAAGENVAWSVGTTTPRDVVSQWGNPDFVHGDTWVWWMAASLGGKVKGGYMGVSATISNVRQGTVECRLTFGPDGKLSRIERVETIPGGATWSINPWD